MNDRHLRPHTQTATEEGDLSELSWRTAGGPQRNTVDHTVQDVSVTPTPNAAVANDARCPKPCVAGSNPAGGTRRNGSDQDIYLAGWPLQVTDDSPELTPVAPCLPMWLGGVWEELHAFRPSAVGAVGRSEGGTAANVELSLPIPQCQFCIVVADVDTVFDADVRALRPRASEQRSRNPSRRSAMSSGPHERANATPLASCEACRSATARPLVKPSSICPLTSSGGCSVAARPSRDCRTRRP